MAELKISGRMSVKKLKENFKNEFGGTLRVYDGREKADESATLASIRRNEDAKGGELICSGNKTVGRFEKEMLEVFGIKVQVATPDDWTLVLDGITLSKLKNIPEKTSKADMESLVAYKRRAKESVDVEETEIPQEIDDDEVYYDAENEDDDVWADFRSLTDEEIEHLNGKRIEVYLGPTNPDDDEDDYEYDSLNYSFDDGEVSYGGGFITDNLADIKIYDFSKDEDLKNKFDRLFDDDERFALNLVLNLINKQIEGDDFPEIGDAVVDDLPIYTIIMKDEDDNPIVEDCNPDLGLGYFQSVI